MMIALAMLFSLQSGEPRIEQVERLLGPVNRPLLWMPLKVTVGSAAGFTGDVVARSGFGFSVAHRVSIPPGGREVILLPALRPSEVTAGKARAEVPRSGSSPERLIVVDSRLPYAAELESTDRVSFVKMDPKDLEKTLGRGLLEAADLVLVPQPQVGARTAPTRADADQAISSLGEPWPAVDLVDRLAWTAAPRGGWVPAKKEWTLFFVTLYAFAGFVSLAVVARRFPKFGLLALASVAVLGICGYGAFPRGQMWIVGQSVECVPPMGDAREYRYWFLQSAATIPSATADFPRLVKPVFPTMGGAEEPFVLRVEGEGCRIEGLPLGPERPACFAGSRSKAPSMRIVDKLPEPLRESVVVRSGKASAFGSLAAGAPVPSPEAPALRPAGASFESWQRFAGPEGLFGIRSGSDEPARDVQSASGLADQHDLPAIFIQRFR